MRNDQVLNALRSCGSSAAIAVSRIAEAISDQPEDLFAFWDPITEDDQYEGWLDTITEMAAEILSSIGPSAIPELVNLLSNEGEEEVWQWAAAGLGRIGADTKEAVPQLLLALAKTTMGDTRYTIRCALKRIDPTALSEE